MNVLKVVSHKFCLVHFLNTLSHITEFIRDESGDIYLSGNIQNVVQIKKSQVILSCCFSKVTRLLNELLEAHKYYIISAFLLSCNSNLCRKLFVKIEVIFAIWSLKSFCTVIAVAIVVVVSLIDFSYSTVNIKLSINNEACEQHMQKQ